jgi:glycosyltransferase involved in cell wall biosynthesis
VFDNVVVAARVRGVEDLPENLSRADGDGVEFLDLPDYTGPWQYLRNIKEIRSRIRNGIAHADAFCLRVPCPIATIVWQELRRLNLNFGVEVVGDPWESLAPGGPRSIVRPIARWSASRNLRAQCHEACAVCYVTRDTLQRRYPPASHAFLDGFSDIQLPPEAVVDTPRSKISDNPRLILVGTLEVLYKAPDVLIRAVAETGRMNLRLTLVGDGRRRQSMEGLATSLAVADQITFAGHLEAGRAVRDALDAADIFVLPSRTEGLPRAMIEAMARGLPCIGSTVGGIPELLPEEDLVPPDDVGALATKIIEFIDNPQRYAEASHRNLEASKQFLSTVLEPRRTAFYAELLRVSV